LYTPKRKKGERGGRFRMRGGKTNVEGGAGNVDRRAQGEGPEKKEKTTQRNEEKRMEKKRRGGRPSGPSTLPMLKEIF